MFHYQQYATTLKDDGKKISSFQKTFYLRSMFVNKVNIRWWWQANATSGLFE